MTDNQDPFLDLLERFAARGVHLRHGNATQDMIKHCLDSIEELEVRVRGIEDGYRRLRGEQALLSGQTPGEPKIGEVRPDGD